MDSGVSAPPDQRATIQSVVRLSLTLFCAAVVVLLGQDQPSARFGVDTNLVLVPATVVDPFNRIEEDRAEHLAILEVRADGDAVRAEQVVVAHLHNLGRYTMSRLSNGLVSDFPA